MLGGQGSTRATPPSAPSGKRADADWVKGAPGDTYTHAHINNRKECVCVCVCVVVDMQTVNHRHKHKHPHKWEVASLKKPQDTRPAEPQAQAAPHK